MWIRRISNAFKQGFCALKDLETDFAIFTNHFFVIAEEVPQTHQMELNEIYSATAPLS